MKKLRYIIIIAAAMILAACTKEDGESVSTRTIMIYFNAENSVISSDAAADLNELAIGAKNLPSGYNLLVFYDNFGQNTTIYRYTKDGKKVLKTYGEDINASDPDNMLDALNTMMTSYPAEEYITIFWGHGTGPYITTQVASGKSKIGTGTGNAVTAYGADCGGTTTWINIPTMVSVLKQLPKQDIIMFDACLMQNVETVYELRGCADYIVGSCCETPTMGAPYASMVPAMCGSDIRQTAKNMVNAYIDGNTWGTDDDRSDGICISAVETSALDNLLTQTHNALDTLKTYSTSCPVNLTVSYGQEYPDVTTCIFYFFASKNGNTQPLYYDMNDVMRNNLCSKDYETWKKALDEAVIWKRHPRDITELIDLGLKSPSGYQICDWVPATLSVGNFSRFLLTDDTFGGLSMYVPKEVYNTVTSPNMNETMYQYEWYNNVGWKNKGW